MNLTEQTQSGARVKVLTKLTADNPDMSGEYQSKLQEAIRANSDTFNRDNVQIILAKCGALLHDVDDQLEKIEAGKCMEWIFIALVHAVLPHTWVSFQCMD